MGRIEVEGWGCCTVVVVVVVVVVGGSVGARMSSSIVVGAGGWLELASAGGCWVFDDVLRLERDGVLSAGGACCCPEVLVLARCVEAEANVDVDDVGCLVLLPGPA